MICKNKRCMKELHEHYWGDGYCCSECMHHCMVYGDGERMADRLCDPTDPTGRRVIAETRDEIDAMIEAMEADANYPRMIYLRRHGVSFRKIAEACTCDEKTVRNRLNKSALKRLHLLVFLKK